MRILDTIESTLADSRRGVWWMALCLAVVTLAVFWRATECGFVNYDDNDYVTNNSDVQKGLTAESVRWAFTADYEHLWIPLTWISHMADWQIYRSNAWGHHLTNVLLHAANAVLLFLLLRFMTGSLWRSAFVAALFALHPLHVESAVWVSERKGVLSTFFWLLALWTYARYARFKVEGWKLRATSYYAPALFFFACGLMAKPIVVTLPFVLLLLDYWPLERWKCAEAGSKARTLQCWRRLIVEKIPFFLLAAMCSAVTFSGAPTSFLTAGQRIGNALLSYPRYLVKTLWPVDLAIPYPHPLNWPAWETMLAVAFLTAATSWVLQQAQRRAYLVTGWLWFLGTLVPVLGLVRMGPYSNADRYTYVSLIGIFVMVAWAAGELLARWHKWKHAAIALTALLLCLCAWRANDQLKYWQDSGALFTHALRVTKDNFVAHNNLGTHLYANGRRDEAMKHYIEAVKLCPQYNIAWENIFAALADKSRDPKAIADYKEMLKSKHNIVNRPPSNWSVAGIVGLGAAIGVLFLKAIKRARRTSQDTSLDRSKDGNPPQE